MSIGEDLRGWYVSKEPVYRRLAEDVHAILVKAIKQCDIPILSVTYRPKDVESFVNKVDKKLYEKPKEEIHDLSGIRVITLIESDVDRVGDVVRQAFNVHPDKSVDKRSELGVNLVGYRSVHYVCDLGVDRLKLTENSHYSGLFFEIQVRSVLQHAWAEFEHDRNYKFAGTLPPEMQRRLYIQAAALESVDAELNRLAEEIKRYDQEVKSETAAGEFGSAITTISLLAYMPTIERRLKDFEFVNIVDRVEQFIPDELTPLGIRTLADLDKYFSAEFIQQFEAVLTPDEFQTDVGLIRAALLYADPEWYFTRAHPGWQGVGRPLLKLLTIKYGEEYIHKLLQRNSIEFKSQVHDQEEYFRL